MTEFLQLVAITSLWIWGVFAVFDEGNLLWGVRKVCEATFGTSICRPLICCPYCMASVHGGAIGLYYYGFQIEASVHGLYYYVQIEVIALVLCVCGLNFIIKTILYG